MQNKQYKVKKYCTVYNEKKQYKKKRSIVQAEETIQVKEYMKKKYSCTVNTIELLKRMRTRYYNLEEGNRI